MIVFDAETSGLDPEKASIVSIGAVDFNNPRDMFYGECRIRHLRTGPFWNAVYGTSYRVLGRLPTYGAQVQTGALKVNGFTLREITMVPKSAHDDLMRDFDGWLQPKADRTLAGENVTNFDLPFLASAFKSAGIDTHFGHRAVDMHSVFYTQIRQRGLIPPIKNGRTDLNADSIFTYVGLFPEPKPHNALTGAKMETEAFGRLINGIPFLHEFSEHPVPQYLELPRYVARPPLYAKAMTA